MDVSCAPTNTNAAKGLVNQLAGGPSAAPFASSSSSTNSAQQFLITLADKYKQLAAQDFFARQAAAARPQYAIPNLLQTAPAPLILAPPHIQQQQQLSHLHSQWAAEFDTPSQHPIRLQQNAHIDFESAFVNARNATFLPAGAGG
ncbi:hypothetical protein HK100_002513 [Physocladia obscura]|uniref:Uncharacterized protein n=1 Tax=Physocladia obscura TaxID=109957 RepID=A0AAD5SVA0_9FUNG|nr:hypothetical protein HK100_002513 [Physocladia obscura]